MGGGMGMGGIEAIWYLVGISGCLFPPFDFNFQGFQGDRRENNLFISTLQMSGLFFSFCK